MTRFLAWAPWWLCPMTSTVCTAVVVVDEPWWLGAPAAVLWAATLWLGLRLRRLRKP